MEYPPLSPYVGVGLQRVLEHGGIFVPPAPTPPTNSTKPVIAGTTVENNTLTVSSGTWTNFPSSYTYKWFAGGVEIGGATNNTLLLTASHIGLNIFARVTAFNGDGSASSDANAVGPVTAAPSAPINTVAPAVTGTTQTGQTLSCTTGTWLHSPSGYTYQWYITDSGGTVIAGATASTFVLTATQVGKNLYCRVTATNVTGNTAANSNTVGPSLIPPPVNSVAPVVSGTLISGNTLSCTTGTWSNSPSGYAYQWHANSVAISGATANSYVLTATEIGKTLFCRVTASNTTGSGSPTNSNTVGPILIPVPVNSGAPVVSGTLQSGQTLSCTTGTWNFSPSGYAYQWYITDSGGTVIAGAINNTFVLTATQIGKNVFCRVTATNGTGSTPADSNTVGPILIPPPVNSVAPVVTGTAINGQVLSCSQGTWSNSPSNYVYQWYITDSGGTVIAGATANTFTLTSAQLAKNVYCKVTASNATGGNSADSNVVGPVLVPAPVNTVAPAVTGTLISAQTLTCSTGTWTNSPSGYTYQWYITDSGGTIIGGATNNTFILTDTQIGKSLFCKVTATNGTGSTVADSNTVGPILIAAPVNTVAPAVTGFTIEGQTLSCTTGTWSNSPSGYAYQWYVNSVLQSGATASTYVCQVADIGFNAQCRVTASNGTGSNFANSNSVGPVLVPAPVNTVAPVASGTTIVGSTLSTTNGTWSNSPSGYTYQWTRNGTNIGSATANTYVLVTADLSASILCKVSASNGTGSNTANSNALGPITPQAPVNSGAPVVSGTTIEGSTLTTTNGTWSVAPDSYTYQWTRGGTNISSATASTYVLVSADIGANILCKVTGTNGGGSQTINSNSVGPITQHAPVNTVAPAVTGTTVEGSTLTTTTGTWSYSPTYTYQWTRGGTNISGATSSTYLLVSADLSNNIACKVIGTNAGGNATATSNSVGPITSSVVPGARPVYAGQSIGANSGTVGAKLNGLPSGSAVGDLVILQVLLRNDTTVLTMVIDSPSGWNLFAGAPFGGTNRARQYLYWKILTAGDIGSTINFTVSGTQNSTLVRSFTRLITAANGFDVSPIAGIVSAAVTASPIDPPAVVNADGLNNRLAFMSTCASANWATFGAYDASWTENQNSGSTTGGTGTCNAQTAPLDSGVTIDSASKTYTPAAQATAVGFYIKPANL